VILNIIQKLRKKLNSFYKIIFKNDKRIINNKDYSFYYIHSKVILEIMGDNSIYYMYNEVEDLIGFKYNNEVYYYIKNGQNDIIGIIDNDYNKS